jgi:hypothetical protein
VRRIAPDGTIGTVAGDGDTRFPPGPDPTDAPSAAVGFPAGLAAHGGGLLIADAEGQRLLFLRDGAISTLSGTGNEAPARADLRALDSPLLYPVSVLADGTGTILSEMGSGRLLRVGDDGTLAPRADGFAAPYGLARDVDGAILVADYGAGIVYRAGPDGREAALDLRPLPSPDDPPVNPPRPASVAVGRDGSLYVAAPDVGIVYRVTADGDVAPFLTPPLVSRPVGLCATPDSRLLIADEGLNRVASESLPYPSPEPGDGDGDGRVTVGDALLGLRHLVGSLPFHRRRFLALDVMPDGPGDRGDGSVTIQDVVRILRMAIGLAPSPVPESDGRPGE